MGKIEIDWWAYKDVFKRLLFGLFVWLVPLCFNLLNIMLAGNLPPFGTAYVVVEDEERYLMVKRSRNRVFFPGGFMRWSEHPMQTARRECREETGLEVELQESFGTYSNVSTRLSHMNTLTVAYTGKLTGAGTLRPSIEGQPCWLTEVEVRHMLSKSYINLLEDYIAFRDQAQQDGKQRQQDIW